MLLCFPKLVILRKIINNLRYIKYFNSFTFDIYYPVSNFFERKLPCYAMKCSRNLVTSNLTTKNTLSEVIRVLERKTPLNYAEPWDNVGLLVEPPDLMTIHSILFTNDLTESVLDEAIAKSVNMIYSYHPPLFSPIKTLKNDNWKSRIIMKCIQAKIAVFSSHTASDAIVGGVNDWLINCFEMKDIFPIKRILPSNCEMYVIKCKKITEEFKQNILNIPTVRLYMDSLDQSCEIIEVQFQHLSKVLHVARGNDNVQICSCESLPASDVGMGRFGQLKVPITIKVAINIIKKHLQLNDVRVSLGKFHTLDYVVKTVAVCAGSGATVLRGTIADLYVTGEMSHHELLDACHNDTTVILCEHSNTERGYLRKLIEDLAKDLKDIQLILSEKDKDPIDIV